MHPILKDIKYLLSETDPAKLALSVAEVAFMGRSNVGKSTLLNALCGKQLARVSGKPGSTRAINVFQAARGRWVVDLPGYGFARVSERERKAWILMLEDYLCGRHSLRMVYCLVDAKVGPTESDLKTLKFLQLNNLPWRVVATKADQVGSAQAGAQRQAIAQAAGIRAEDLAWVSAAKHLGIPELRAEMTAILQKG